MAPVGACADAAAPFPVVGGAGGNGGAPLQAAVADDGAAPDGQPGGAVPAAPAGEQRGASTSFCNERLGAVPQVDDPSAMRERWRVVRRIVHTFRAEPFVGAYAGLQRAKSEPPAAWIVSAMPGCGWMRLAIAVESVGIVWPFLEVIE